MFSTLALLSLAALVSAQIDLSDRNEISTDANLYLHVEIDQIFYRKSSANTTQDSVVMQFNDIEIELPIKRNLLDSEAADNLFTKPYNFIADTCLRSVWNNTGVAALPAPHVVVDEEDTYIYQYVDYADLVMYSDFERPNFLMEAKAFKQSTPSTSCTPGASDVVATTNFTHQLCYTQNSVCNVWIGSSGWVYWGGNSSTPTMATADFGVRLQPQWNWTGTRREFELNDTNLLEVRAVDSLSDSYAEAQSLLSRAVSIPFEFDECRVMEDGALVFSINDKGFLERQLSCNSLVLKPYSYFVFDFADEFVEANYADVKLPGTESRWNLTFYPIRVKYGSTFEIEVDPDEYKEPLVELNRLPDGYVLDGANWLTTYEPSFNGPDRIKTWFTIRKLETGSTTAPTTTTTRPPVIGTLVVPMCPMGCNGKGRCQPGNTCQCDNGFVTDATFGCKAMETSGAAPTGTVMTVQVVSVVQPPTQQQVTITTEARRTIDPKLVSGTGTRPPTPAPVTKSAPATEPTTGGAASAMISGAVALLALSLAL